MQQPNNASNVATIEQCLLFLASRCDGAVEEDGRGFNSRDANFGNSLARHLEGGGTLTQGQSRSALAMIKTYKKQLLAGGLSLPEECVAPPPAAPTMVSVYRLEVDDNSLRVSTPYDPALVQILKNLPYKDRRYDNVTKSWVLNKSVAAQFVVSISDFDFWIDPAVTELIESTNAAVVAEQSAKELAAMGMADRIHRMINHYDLTAPLPVGWPLRDYQRQGVEWLVAHTRGNMGRGAILADDMGTGKTISAVCAARSVQTEYSNIPILVICPVSLMANWHIEAAYAGVQIEAFSWAKLPPPLEHTDYILIVDEAHYSQGGVKTKRGRAFLELCQNDRCVAAWLLTGTPMKNGQPLNILPLLQAIDHPVARDEWAFKMRYCAGHQKYIGNKTVWDFKGSAYLKELSDKLNDSVLRRLKTEVAKELPGKTRIIRPVEEVRLFREAIEKVVIDYKRRIVEIDKEDPEKAESLRNAEALVTLGKFRETSSHFKMQEAIDIAEGLLACDQQVVLFTEFNATANFLHEKLGGELLDGKTKDRQGAVDRFQSGESKVFVSTIRAGGVGITLTAASETIMVDRPWTPGDLEQAEDRTNRIGQPNMCFIYWLQLGDIDRSIDELLHQKAERIELMLKGKRKTLRGVRSPMELAKVLLEGMI